LFFKIVRNVVNIAECEDVEGGWDNDDLDVTIDDFKYELIIGMM